MWLPRLSAGDLFQYNGILSQQGSLEQRPATSPIDRQRGHQVGTLIRIDAVSMTGDVTYSCNYDPDNSNEFVPAAQSIPLDMLVYLINMAIWNPHHRN